MLTGLWFLNNIKDLSDLRRLAKEGKVTPSETRYLKAHAEHYINDKHGAMFKWNKEMAMNLWDTYMKVLKRFEELEDERAAEK